VRKVTTLRSGVFLLVLSVIAGLGLFYVGFNLGISGNNSE